MLDMQRRDHDIICAAVSALAVNTINAIEQFTEDPFEVEEAEDGGLLPDSFFGSAG